MELTHWTVYFADGHELCFLRLLDSPLCFLLLSCLSVISDFLRKVYNECIMPAKRVKYEN